MFDDQLYTRLRDLTGQVAAGREHTALATGPQVCDALRQVQASIDILDGIRADLLSRLQDTEGHADEGASSVIGWARQQLRMTPTEARQHRKAGDTLHTLPDVAAALAAGRIRAAHVYEFTAGITKLGATIMSDLEDLLLPIAETCDPHVLRAAINEVHEIVNDDELDDKYAKGMDRRDLKAAKCGDGFHLTGFLDTITGTKFTAWLKDVSRPEYDGDDRTPSERRVDAFHRLLTTTTTNTGTGTDTDTGTGGGTDTGTGSGDTGGTGTGSGDTGETTRETEQTTEPDGSGQGPRQAPGQGLRRADTRLLVLADLDTLLRLPGAAPATLAGYGHIGGQLLGYLTCNADPTAILTHGLTHGPVPQANVLNVGRTHRLATPAQRAAITARQGGHCANPGCGLTHLEIHHVAWWDRDGGTTDLSNLVGICTRCHHLVHQNKLTIRADGHGGHTFHRHTGRIIDDHTRITKQRVRDLIATIRHAAADPSSTDPPRPRPRRFDPHWLTPLEPRKRSSGDTYLYEFISRHAPPTCI